MVNILSRIAVAATLVGLSAAQLQIISPGGPDLWWVAKSINTLTWTCQTSPFQTYTVLIANKDPKILPAPMAFIGVQNNFDCSKSITPDQVNQTPATGYTIQLADTLNSTNIFATSQEFEIKALGAAYPTTTSVPAGASGSATGSGSSPASTGSTNSKSGASGIADAKVLSGFGMAAVGVVLGLMTA
ncbi:hypothetical protein BD779DRAFT_1572482 [Infundibulicybe gibba]|nr:hypothetical protein BD779DRAFT_1572482 [Infundibulicybe gibba]